MEVQKDIPFGYISAKTASKRYKFNQNYYGILANKGSIIGVKCVSVGQPGGLWYLDPASIEAFIDKGKKPLAVKKKSRKKTGLSTSPPPLAKNLPTRRKLRKKTLWQRIKLFMKG